MNKFSYQELEKEFINLQNVNIQYAKDKQYKGFFDSRPEMVQVIELIYDKKQQPIDFYIRDLNLSCARFLGKTKEQLLNKKISSIVDTIEDSWFKNFARVDKNGITHSFKNYGVEFDKYYFVTVWKISKNRVGISLIDITKTEKAEIELKKREEKERIETDLLLKEKKMALNSSIYKLGTINAELTFQKEKKDERAEALVIAKKAKAKRINELVIVRKELTVQKKEKDERAVALVIAEKAKAKRINELIIVRKELAVEKEEKDDLADQLVIAKNKLTFHSEKKDDLIIAKKEKVARVFELAHVKRELVFQSEKKNDLAIKLVLAKKELDHEKEEKDNRAEELVIAKKEKAARVKELIIAKKELAVQKEIEGYRSEMGRLAQELTLLIENANIPIFGIGNKGLINEWNKTAEEITGYKKEEVLGKNLVQTYITETYRKPIKKVLSNALKGKETKNYEFLLYSKKGKRIIVLLNTSSRRDVKGKITGVLAVGQDITELVGYRKELELKVDERTLKLNEALKKQKELTDLKSRFISVASHEFRTPLSAINFAAGSIKKYWTKMEPIMIEKKLHKIENQVMHMTELLDDILTVSQAEAGAIKNIPKNINLGNFMHVIIEEVFVSCQKTHEILLIDPQNLKNGVIRIDEKLGRNIFINLLSNAIKFSPKAKSISIGLSSEKEYLNITITDFGIGIPKSEFKNIFNPFTRGKNVDLIQGTGLGLSIVKDAIDTMGGEIIITSTIGGGSTFTIKIPKN